MLILIIVSFPLYSVDFFSQETLDRYRSIGVIGDQGVGFKIEHGNVLLKFTGSFELSDYWPEINGDSYSFSKDDIVLKENGYLYTKVFIWEESVLFGSRFFLFLNDRRNSIGHGINGIGSFSGLDFSGATGAIYNETLIQNIECTSYLKEGAIQYSTDTLSRYLGYFSYTHSPDLQVFNGNARPWVEGVDGPGIGEQLTITFTEPYSDIVVLNGFVDRNRKHLFKENNRVKTAIIRSDDSGEPFEFEYHFEDMVRFDEIRFPRTAKKVIFEIKNVYPGEKWDDTCISAVLTREPDPYKGTEPEEDVEEEPKEKKVYSLDER
jgi:hypothetical protein